MLYMSTRSAFYDVNSLIMLLFFPFAGRVPSLQEGNMNENIFSFPWLKDGPIVLGMCKDLILQDFVLDYGPLVPGRSI